MARQFLIAIDLAKNELQNAAVHNLAAAPSSPVKGQLYMNTSDNTLYFWDGTTWQSAKAGGGLTYGNVVTETAFGQASNNGAATSVARSDHTHGSPTHGNAEHTTIPLNTFAVPTGTVAFGNQKITGLANGTTSSDAVNKGQLDAAIQGLSWKDSVKAASTANLALSGVPSPIDGVTVAANDRVLLKNQTAPAENGIWNVSSGAWSRATDADIEGDLLSAAVFVEQGTTQGNTAWVMTTDSPITVGTTALTWVQISNSSGNVPTNRTLTAGAGLTGGGDLSADRTFDVGAGLGITVAADAVAIDPTYFTTNYPRKVTVPCAAATTTVVNHAWGSRNILCNVHRATTPWDTVECDVERTDINNVTIRFAVAPSAGAYNITLVGG